MNTKTVAYVALCLLVPPLWGLISYWVFELLGLRRRRKAAEAPPAEDSPEARGPR